MSRVAPYTNSMRIGQGFNSYTQEIRLENAVNIPRKSTTVLSTSDTVQLVRLPSTSKINGAVAREAPLSNGKPGDTAAFGTANPDDHKVEPNGGLQSKFANAQVIKDTDDAIFNPAGTDMSGVFSIPEQIPVVSQSVTYSTRAIENVSDIMDALNISASTSIKYGTIHGNASGSYVNETKVLDSQLNYVVSCKVNNERSTEMEEMIFQPIESVPKDQFTALYGDCFISDFLEGGEFNAIISIQVHDKSKLSQIKQAIDVQLAVGPPPLSVQAKEAFDKEHTEMLQNSEVSISVNWVGGGEIKHPNVPWTISSVVAVANAFPSMVARCSAKTSAILTRYTSLRSFNEWLFKKQETNEVWREKDVILNYAPCQIYTADLFDALMSYKKLWKRIDTIMVDMSKWRAREQKEITSDTEYSFSPGSKTIATIQKINAALEAATDPNATAEESKAAAAALRAEKARRAETFAIDENLVGGAAWDLKENNDNRTPIPLDPVALNEARLLCREAMTLITEEAASLVNHPDLAYAEYDIVSGKTRMKRPNYPYPEVIQARLPAYIRNDAANDSTSTDPASILVRTFVRDNDLYSQLVGDAPNPHRKYRPFVSMTLNEGHNSGSGIERRLCGLSLHAYHHHGPSFSNFSKDSHNAIGAIGFHFAGDKDLKPDKCSRWYGHPHTDNAGMYHCLDIVDDAAGKELDICKIKVYHTPGTGRIAGLSFYDNFHGVGDTEQLWWRQWGSAGNEPDGLVTTTLEPPKDGAVWKLVGIMGDFDQSLLGCVLSRFSGVWRRV